MTDLIRLGQRRLFGSPIFGLMLLALVSGCGPRAPYDIAKVSGKVTYENGLPIKAQRVIVVFHPQDYSDKKFGVRRAHAEVDVETGEFESATTWKYADGAAVGRHKITIETYDTVPGGRVDQVTTILPQRYSSPKDTPLECNVVKRGENRFLLQVGKQ
jgi:hypothetical protein